MVVLALGLGDGWAVGPTGAAQAGTEDVIVVLRSDVQDPAAVARDLSQAHGLEGFAARVPAAARAALERNPRVAFVDRDLPVFATAQTLPTGVDRIDADRDPTAAIDGNDTRVNADVAILDSGVNAHEDLSVVGGKDCTGTGSYADDNGHGTHVAGTVGALDNRVGVVGVAPGVRLWAVKVLKADGSGSWSSVICGIDWVTANAATIDVANVSLAGGGADGACRESSLHLAICNSVDAGVTYAVAAGNDSLDASTQVPATYDQVITVSALTDFDGKPGGASAQTLGCANGRVSGDDGFACFSNYGADVDIAAPGVAIRSTAASGGYATMSGTSMAAPHVAGAAALHIAASGRVGPALVKQALLATWEQAAMKGDPDGIDEGILSAGAPPPADLPDPELSAGQPLLIVGGGQSANSNDADNVYDDSLDTVWRTKATTPKSAFVFVDLGTDASVDTISWVFSRTGFADRFTIAVSSDGDTWTTLANRRNAKAGTWQSLQTGGVTGRYIRFRFSNPNRDIRLGFLGEVEIYGTLVGTATTAASDAPPTSTGGAESGTTDPSDPAPTTTPEMVSVAPSASPAPTSEPEAPVRNRQRRERVPDDGA